MKKKWIVLAVLGLLIVIGVLAGIKFLQIRAMIDQGKKFVPPPETVTATAVKSETWSTSLTAVGTLNAVQGVTVSAELAGKVVDIGFHPGAYVHKGDLLLRQDTTTEQAQLIGALAQAELTRTTLQRDVKMLAERIISQADYDSAVASREQALAQAENIRTTISKKDIRAPFSGRLGIRQVNLGQTLKEGDAIVTLQNLDPIFVDFSLPQQHLARLEKDQQVRVTCDAFPDLTTSGKVTTINPLVDADTRNIKLEATIENRKERLRPGMFVNVEVGLPVRQQVLSIPTTAVLYAPYGDSVFLIVDAPPPKPAADQKPAPDKGGAPAQGGTGKVLRQQFVRLGEKRGDFVAVTSGLKQGDLVVSTGVFKLRNGQAVLVDNRLQPAFQQAPKPENN